MSFPVVMPQLGLTMTEGSVAEWLKKPGEAVHKGEMLFVVSTDKADMEVESLDEGELTQIVVEPGITVPVGTVIAYLGGSGEAAAGGAAKQAPTPAPTPPPLAKEEPSTAAVQATPAARTRTRTDGCPASPRARKGARELGVDLAKVTPSGSSGRIVEDDVRRFAQSAKPQASPAAPPDLRQPAVDRGALDEEHPDDSAFFPQRSSARRPTFVALRESLKEPVKEQTGLKLTITDLLLKALGLALAETPGCG